MSRRKIEIEDDLERIIQQVKDEVEEAFSAFRGQNPKFEPNDWAPHDRIFEICDGATPIYTAHIDGLYYLYGEEFEKAYRNAGIGHGDEHNHKQAAIFCYLKEAAWEEAHRLQTEAEEDLEALQ